MEPQQLLQLEAILYALRRQDNFQSFPFNLSAILYMCFQTIFKQINKVWNLPSTGLRPLVRWFHSWFWICPGLSLRNYGKSTKWVTHLELELLDPRSACQSAWERQCCSIRIFLLSQRSRSTPAPYGGQVSLSRLCGFQQEFFGRRDSSPDRESGKWQMFSVSCVHQCETITTFQFL